MMTTKSKDNDMVIEELDGRGGADNGSDTATAEGSAQLETEWDVEM